MKKMVWMCLAVLGCMHGAGHSAERFVVSSGDTDQFVTTHAQGQLGNHMFQVAAAVAYALDNDINAQFPQMQGHYPEILGRINTDPFPVGSVVDYFQEKHYAVYAPLPQDRGTNLVLYGFFQSEKYFAHHRDAILEMFAPPKEIVEWIEEDYDELLKEKTVAIHIRTFIPDGSNPALEGFRGVAWDYFVRAMDRFPDEDTHFLVFSDANEWVREHFPETSRNVTFIEGNPLYIDFYLMSLCKHQILSPSSTYSWWAAWLNQNPEKVVVAPDGSTYGPDFYPEEWIQLRTKRHKPQRKTR